MVFDFHNHFFPKAYLDELAKGRAARVGRDRC